MKQIPSVEKQRFRKRWLLLPILGLGLFVVLQNSASKAQLDAGKLEQDLWKFLKAQKNLQVVSTGSWLHWEDLPLMARLSIVHPTLQSILHFRLYGPHVNSSGDETTAFFVEDSETKTNFEIAVHCSTAHQVLAVAVHYPEGEKTRAQQIRRDLSKRFNGLDVYLRNGYLDIPGMTTIDVRLNSEK